MKMKLAEIAKAVAVKNDITKWCDVEITSVAFDSRNLSAGALFVPLVGQTDGHRFVSAAFDNGAFATLWASDHSVETSDDQPVLVVDDPLKAMQELGMYYLRKINPMVVAVTGSNGKTTTKDMIASILSTQMNVTKTYANFNNQIGVPTTLLSMEPNTEAVVVEMGMDHFGELDFLSKMVNPDIAVITMIGEAHIEFFGTRDKIADAKMEITHGLKEDGTLVYNGDEPLLTSRAAEVEQEQQKFGRQLSNDIYATSVNASTHQISFTTNLWPEDRFTIPMMGEYNVNNALAALMVGNLLRISVKHMQTALADVELTDNRVQWVQGSAGEQILSDVYNSNPTAAKQVLHAFSKTPTAGKRVVVLGDMLELGDAAAKLHASLAGEFEPSAITDVYLIGPHMKALYHKLTDQYDFDHLHHYDVEDKDQLTSDVKANLTADDVVMLKASHGLHLETVLAALTD